MCRQVLQSKDGCQRVFIIPLGDGRYRLVEKTKIETNFVRPSRWPRGTRALPGVFDSITAARREICSWDGFSISPN